ncbi:MAG TPA: histone deacetylase [Bryobacteraceae bacterium]|nr:histone deacetylase [Bryobacteraceae bacterium]
MATTALLLDSFYKQHVTGSGHPERPERYDAILSGLEREGLVKECARVERRSASEDEVAMAHAREYIAVAKRDIRSGAHDLSTGDTAVGPRSLDVALDAVGGVLNAVDMVVGGRVKNAFCAVRPPGHHATALRGMGFCVFNNIAVAARYAQKKHGLARVLIADWDVHHGNGTQDIFYHDGSVYFFSTHQSPWYPGTGAAGETGEGSGKGSTLNCPFAAGAGRSEIVGALRERLIPAMDAFQPELVMISAGFDSRVGDPLGQFRLTDEDFADLTRMLMDVADKHAGGRVVSVLEGGYSLTGLAAGVASHVKTLTHA